MSLSASPASPVRSRRRIRFEKYQAWTAHRKARNCGALSISSVREGQSGISTQTLTLDGLPVGDWSVLLVASFSDGKLTVTGQPDYFRVIVR